MVQEEMKSERESQLSLKQIRGNPLLSETVIKQTTSYKNTSKFIQNQVVLLSVKYWSRLRLTTENEATHSHSKLTLTLNADSVIPGN